MLFLLACTDAKPETGAPTDDTGWTVTPDTSGLSPDDTATGRDDSGSVDSTSTDSASATDSDSAPPPDTDGDGWIDAEDCAPDDATVNPGATEVCGDGLDNDCDGGADDCAWSGESTVEDGWLRFVPYEDDYAGYSASGVGDLTGDGAADLVICAPLHYAANGFGRVYVMDDLSPGEHALADAVTTWDAWDLPQQFGFDAVGADFDGDGDGDVAMTLQASDVGDNGVWIAHGPVPAGAWLGAETDTQWLTDAPSGSVGALDLPGDVDGDGAQDLLLASPYTDAHAWLLTDPSPGSHDLADAALIVEGGLTLGTAISAGQDEDGDGVTDLWLSEPEGAAMGVLWRVSADERGTVQVGDVASAVLYGDGASVVATTVDPIDQAGDLDGDGLADVVFGEPTSDGTTMGVVYVVAGASGEADLSAAARLTFTTSTAGSMLGSSIEAPGDFTGDGLPDLLVGADQDAGGNGRMYLLDPTGTGTEWVEDATAWFAGDHVIAWMGAGSISTIDDLSGDGLPEVIVAEPGLATMTGGPSVAVYGSGPM